MISLWDFPRGSDFQLERVVADGFAAKSPALKEIAIGSMKDTSADLRASLGYLVVRLVKMNPQLERLTLD